MRIVKTAAASLIACLVAAASPGSGQAAELTPIKVRMSWTPFGFHTALFLAMDRGYFKDGGIDVQPEDGSGSTATVSLVGSGQYDIGEAAISSMDVGRQKGLPLKAIALFIRQTDTGVLVPKDMHITEAKQLEGKKVIYTAGSLEGPFMVPFFKAGGADVSKVMLTNVDFSAKIPTYVTAQGDAVVTSVPFILPVLKDKRPSDAIMFSKYGFLLPGNGYIATEETIKTKGPALRAFVAGISRAWKEVLEEGKLDDGVQAEIKYRPQAKLDPNLLKEQVEAYRSYFYTPGTKDKPFGWQSPEEMTAAINSLKQVNLVAADAKPEDFYTNEFFPK